MIYNITTNTITTNTFVEITTPEAFIEASAKISIIPGYEGSYSRQAETDADFYGEDGELNEVLEVDFRVYDTDYNLVELSSWEHNIAQKFIERWLIDNPKTTLDSAEPTDERTRSSWRKNHRQ